MEEKIVKDGTKIILFALDTEDTSVTGQLWMANSCMSVTKELDGTEGDLDNLMRKDFEVVPNKFSNFCCGISSVFYGDQKRAQFISCQHWYLLQQKRKVERM